MRRIGRWTYGSHPGLNPGWRLDDTEFVLDFDPKNTSGSLRGSYCVWINGREVAPVDHYLPESMAFVEANVAYYRRFKTALTAIAGHSS